MMASVGSTALVPSASSSMERTDSKDSGSSLDSGASQGSLEKMTGTDASSTCSSEDMPGRFESCGLDDFTEDHYGEDGLESIEEENDGRVSLALAREGTMRNFWNVEQDSYVREGGRDGSISPSSLDETLESPLRPGRRSTPSKWHAKETEPEGPLNALEAHVAALSFSNSGLTSEIHRRDATILALRRVIEGNEESMRNASIWKSLANQAEHEVLRLRQENHELRRMVVDECSRREKCEDEVLTLQTLLSRSKLSTLSPKTSLSSGAGDDSDETVRTGDKVRHEDNTQHVDFTHQLLPDSTWGGRGGSPFVGIEYEPYSGTPSPGGGGDDEEEEEEEDDLGMTTTDDPIPT